MAIKILFLTPYPFDEAPSQRFRFEQYFELLSENNFKYAIKPFLTQKAWQVFYNGSSFIVAYYLLLGFMRRFIHVFKAILCDFVFIHREASPMGPPVFEWLIARVLRKKIIFDFDDAIWLEDHYEKGTLLGKLKWKSKVASICKWSYKVSVGNEYLAQFARQYNENVIINPTTIDTKNVHNPELFKKITDQVRNDDDTTPVRQHEVVERSRNTEIEMPPFDLVRLAHQASQGTPVIGWTGTHSTLQYLNPVLSVIERLEEKYDFIFLVIANKNPEFNLRSFRFIPWDKNSEIEDLMSIDIGIMPLKNDEWSKGKCGFKLLQYMALEKPTLASPVGVNSDIVIEGENGYLCDSESEWYNALELLLKKTLNRAKLGSKGRQHVVDHYSVKSNQANFLSLFE